MAGAPSRCFSFCSRARALSAFREGHIMFRAVRSDPPDLRGSCTISVAANVIDLTLLGSEKHPKLQDWSAGHAAAVPHRLAVFSEARRQLQFEL